MLFLSCIASPPRLAEKLEAWRPFVDGPIEAVELDCDHDHILLPEPVARMGPALCEQLARTEGGKGPMRFPVSFAQQRLWFLEQLTPGEPTYNLPYACWLEGPLDAHALQRAMDAMVGRHAVLRTSIVGYEGVPEQVVADTGTVPIERIELPPGPDGGEHTRRPSRSRWSWPASRSIWPPRR